MDVMCRKGAGAAQRIENTTDCQPRTEGKIKKENKTKPTETTT